TFDDDFRKVLSTYVGKGERIYVFIDDLDRCEIPKAADLMQALNLLMSTGESQFTFILGLDRTMVAASLAAKYERVLPYLPGYGNGSSSQKIEYGYAFLEKFVQVPFRIPRPGQDSLRHFLI